jgi:hypothetical protein
MLIQRRRRDHSLRRLVNYAEWIGSSLGWPLDLTIPHRPNAPHRGPSPRATPHRSGVVDLGTGDVVVSYSRERPPAADTTFVFGDDGLTVTDPDTETVLMQIPIETYQSTQVADPFHVAQLANRALDECRRRVPKENVRASRPT